MAFINKHFRQLTIMARTKQDELDKRRGRVSDPTSSSDVLSSSEEDSRRKDGRRISPDREVGRQVKKVRVNQMGGKGDEEEKDATTERAASSSEENVRDKKKDKKRKKKVVAKKVKKGPSDGELRERYERKKQYDRENAKR